MSRLTDLFSLELNLIFYDLTSSYFEGQSCPLAEFGYSRDRRPDKKQILLGLLVTDEGLPIAHQVYNGSVSDKSTLKTTIDTLKERFRIKRCIFVGDRSPQRVKGHVMVCVLAYLVEKILEKSLKRANLGLTPREALDRLDTLRLVENKIAGHRLFCVTAPSKEHHQILKSLNIKSMPRILKR